MNAQIFKTIKGEKPLLISAPHAYSHRRPSLTMSYKIGEQMTDNIVVDLCDKHKTYGIFLSNESDFDPNYHKISDNPYKQQIKDIIDEDKIKYFIDIHGLKEGNLYDIAIYYPSGFSKSIRLANQIREGLDKKDLRGTTVAILRFPDNYQKPLGKYVASSLRVPAVQLEVAKYIRDTDKLRNSFIENLGEVLDTLSK
jgi:hypothetical protein